MTWRAIAILACLVCAIGPACGDNAARSDDLITATSGARLALQRYRFDDGTELIERGEFYDTELHTRCRPQAWSDGTQRCTPVADDAVYRDPACSELLGVGRTIDRPAYFVARDTGPDGPAPRVFRAGAIGGSLAVSYARVGGDCVGPTPIAMGVSAFYELGAELAGDALVALSDSEVASDRLAVQIRAGDDGLRVPTGLRDRALAAACTPRSRSDGSVVCEPSDIAQASYYADPACSAPVAVVGEAGEATAPALARLAEPSGCASYYRIAGEIAPPVYHRDGASCTAASPPDSRTFALGTPVALASLPRTVETAAGHRLRRVVLDIGGMTIADDRLFDPQTGVDCRPRALRDAIRCVPENLITAAQLYSDAGCTVSVRLAEVPAHSCGAPAAYAATSRPFQIRAIGDIVASPLYRLDGTCQRYTAAAGNELRALGAVLDTATLPWAIYYSER